MNDNETSPDRPLLEIRKYQNRRYYDTTNSEHLSMEQIHRKICEGYDIRVVDAKTEADITAKILTQILLEYEPMKLEFLSSDLLLQVIRVNDKILKDFYQTYFGEAIAVFLRSKDQFDQLLRQTHLLPGYGKPMGAIPFATAIEAFTPFASVFRPEPAKQDPDDLAKEVQELKKQVEELRSQPPARKAAGKRA